MLPSFVSSKSRNARTDRPRGTRGRLQSWDHLPTDQVIQRGAKAAAEADASRGVMVFGNLMMVAMIIFSILMAAAAMQREARLERLQPQVQQVK